MAISHYIEVPHGKLMVKVPRKMFVGPEAEFDEERAAAFRVTLAARYPWLSKYAIEIIMENSQRVMLNVLESEKSELQRARDAIASGKDERAVQILRKHLEKEPRDADGWYILGEVLCRMGDAQEGYRAFAEARKVM
jgi:cytochrome c-type biogenesis protein CcmH/NrfG